MAKHVSLRRKPDLSSATDEALAAALEREVAIYNKYRGLVRDTSFGKFLDAETECFRLGAEIKRRKAGVPS